MDKRRWVRGTHDDVASFDWQRPARQLGVRLEDAQGLFDEAQARARYPGSRRAEDLYLDWLEAFAPLSTQLEPGKRTRTMRLAADMGEWPRLARLDEVPADP